MKLHTPVKLCVLLSKLYERCRLVAVDLFLCKRLALHSLCKYSLNVYALRIRSTVKSVVAYAAAVFVEEVYSVIDRLYKVGICIDLNTRCRSKLAYVAYKCVLFDIEHEVRTERRNYLSADMSLFSYLLVPFKCIYRIVCCAYDLNIRCLDKLCRAHLCFLDNSVCLVPDLFPCVLSYNGIYSEITL